MIELLKQFAAFAGVDEKHVHRFAHAHPELLGDSPPPTQPSASSDVVEVDITDELEL